MIRLRKGPIPQILLDNATRWLDELKAAIETGDLVTIRARRSRYNHRTIKDAVTNETSGKCAYCEGHVTAVAHGDIEHVFPKSLVIEVTFDWSNLGFSCQICNQNKSDRNPNSEGIIDPYSKDPEPFIRFVGPFVNSNGSIEGRSTIHNLRLDRADLTERRLLLMRNLLNRLELIQMARTDEEKKILIDDFEENELGDKLEFSAMRRDF